MKEEWRSCVGFRGYEVSDLGNVRTWRSANGRGYAKSPRAMKQRPDKDNYLYVQISNDRYCCAVRVHRLVLDAFVGLRALGEQARHLDGNRQNNRPTNLVWGTAQQNADDRGRHGYWLRRVRETQAKLSARDIIAIKRLIDRGATQVEAAKKFGVTQVHISAIVRGLVWSGTGQTSSRKNAVKLTEDDVKVILRSTDTPASVLARTFNVTPSHISAIRKKHKWRTISAA